MYLSDASRWKKEISLATIHKNIDRKSIDAENLGGKSRMKDEKNKYP